MSVGEHDRQQAIRARVNAATEGPWEVDDISVEELFGQFWEAAPAEVWAAQKADAEFIAHAREDIPWLLAELAVVREERDRLREIVAAARRATTSAPGSLAGSVEHSTSCAIWVEFDDVSAELHPAGTCDCGLSALLAALSVSVPDGQAAPRTFGVAQSAPCESGNASTEEDHDG